MDHLGSQEWFDRRSASQQDLVTRIHKSCRVPQRILPEEHGSTIEDQLGYAKKLFLEQKGPFSFGRIGDCELAWLGAGYLHERMPLENLKTLESQLITAGLNRDALKMRPQFLDALRKLTLLGVQQNWPPIRETTAALMWLSGFEVPPPNAVDFHLLYRLLVDGTLFNWMAGKRVFMVGISTPALAQKWTTPEFVKTYRRFGPVDQINIVGTQTTRGRGAEGSWLDLDDVTRTLEKSAFDVAFLSCGAMAKILAVRVQEMGRTALDAGFIVDALLGHSQRTERTVIRDGAWPEKEGR